MIGLLSLGFVLGKELNAIAPKHSENRLKFWGHAEGISSGESTLRIAESCRSEKSRVMCLMTSVGEGEPVPLVESAQTRAMDPSNTSLSSLTGTAVPKPYYSHCKYLLKITSKMTYIVWFIQKHLSDSKKDPIGNGEDKTT